MRFLCGVQCQPHGYNTQDQELYVLGDPAVRLSAPYRPSASIRGRWRSVQWRLRREGCGSQKSAKQGGCGGGTSAESNETLRALISCACAPSVLAVTGTDGCQLFLYVVHRDACRMHRNIFHRDPGVALSGRIVLKDEADRYDYGWRQLLETAMDANVCGRRSSYLAWLRDHARHQPAPSSPCCFTLSC